MKLQKMQTDLYAIESRLVVVWGQGWKKERLPMGMRKVLRIMNRFVILIAVMVSPLYTYVKTHQIVHFVCKVYCTSIVPQ